MKIGNVQKFSLIEYPEKICAIAFVQGCNFRCPYCYNPELVDSRRFEDALPEQELFDFLDRRKGKLDAVVVTGGEPTLQPDLAPFLRTLRAMGYLVKLDTNGSRPEVLKKIIDEGLADYYAMDIKAPLERYGEVTRSEVDPDKIRESIKLIITSQKDHEFRTTMVESMLSREDMKKMARLIHGANSYAMQRFKPLKLLEPEFCRERSHPDEDLNSFKKIFAKHVGSVALRG